MSKKWDHDGHFNRLDQALRINQKIWTIFQGDLAQDGHPLPKKIREDILGLSLFVDKRTFEVMTHPVSEKLNILIDINQNIAAGLRSSEM